VISLANSSHASDSFFLSAINLRLPPPSRFGLELLDPKFAYVRVRRRLTIDRVTIRGSARVKPRFQVMHFMRAHRKLPRSIGATNRDTDMKKYRFIDEADTLIAGDNES